MDADDAISLKENCGEEFKVYHLFSIIGSLLGEKTIGFMSPKCISALQSGVDGTVLQADATFYVISKQFYQLFNIFQSISPVLYLRFIF